jgi:Putative ABC exporter
VGIVGVFVAVYIRTRYPEVMSEQLGMAAIPIVVGAASYLGFLIMLTAQAGFSAPQRNLTNFQLLPIKPMELAIGMLAGSMLMWTSVRIALFLPALVVTSFHPLESLACLFAGFAFDVALVSAVNLVTGTTGLRGMAQGPPDILQGVRAIVFMLVVMCSIVPTLLIAGLVTFIVGVVIGFSIAGCALTAAIAALLVQPFIWWFTGTVFLRRELPAA